MSDKPSQQDLLEVQEHFGLPSPALVEKDWYVVKALAAIAATDVTPFRLVFGGGTALSRARGLIRRMSEDIDLKIIAEEIPSRNSLRALRGTLTKVLQAAGFEFDPDNTAHRESANASRYTIYRLPYTAITSGVGVLRPEIQIETAYWPLRHASENLTVTSFVAEAFKQPAEISAIACVSITETAAEKLVALSRRAGAELAAANGPRDPTLVRHIYDLHMLREHFDTAEVLGLAQQIMIADAEEFGHQFPAYRENPITETIRAIEGIAASQDFVDRYATFLRDMVYGEKPAFEQAIVTIQKFLAPLNSIQKL